MGEYCKTLLHWLKHVFLSAVNRWWTRDKSNYHWLEWLDVIEVCVHFQFSQKQAVNQLKSVRKNTYNNQLFVASGYDYILAAWVEQQWSTSGDPILSAYHFCNC